MSSTLFRVFTVYFIVCLSSDSLALMLGFGWQGVVLVMAASAAAFICGVTLGAVSQ